MKIIFFSPFSAVLPHKRAEVLLADGLQKSGHEIFFVNCNGIFGRHCIAMSGNGLNEFSDIKAKETCCKMCRQMRDWNNAHFKFKNCNIDNSLSGEESGTIDKILEVVNQENALSFTYDGFEIGKIASYEFMISYKKTDLEFTDNEWAAYSIAIKNTLMTYFAFKKIIESSRPDVVMYYDGGYSINGMVKALALKNNILAYDFSGGLNIADRYSKLIVTKEDLSKLYENLKKKKWDILKNKTIRPSEIQNVGSHFRSLFKASDFAVYSSPRVESPDRPDKIKKQFSVNPNQKFLVATLCSYDERFAENILGRTITEDKTLFSSQAEWCLSLIDWVKDRPQYFLLIRVHPREFPNKRERLKSVHAQKLESIFCNLPANVAINWPQDKISIYNLAEEADVFLNAWSTVGVEMSLLGLPVVVYSDELLYYPSELNYLGKTKEMYFNNIEKAISDGWSFEKVRLTFRWCASLFCFSTITMHKRHKILFWFLSKAFRLLRKITKLRIFNNIINYLYFNGFYFPKKEIQSVEIVLRNKLTSLADVALLNNKEMISPEEEAEYICNEMERLYTGTKSKILAKIKNYRLKCLVL